MLFTAIRLASPEESDLADEVLCCFPGYDNKHIITHTHTHAPETASVSL